MYKKQHQWELLVEVEGVAEEAVVGGGDLCGGRVTSNLKKNTIGPGVKNRGGLMEISRRINRKQFTASWDGKISISTKRIRLILYRYLRWNELCDGRMHNKI